MESFIFEFIDKYLNTNITLVYIVFLLSNITQLVFPPFPADVVLVFQGYLTVASNKIEFIPILFIAILGTFIGSIIVYKFGYKSGDKVFDNWLVRRFIDVKHRNRAESLFEKYGSYAIFMSKFVPGVNAIILLFAGVFKVKPRLVYISVISSALVHHIAVLLLGRFLGNNLSSVRKIFKTYNYTVIIIIVVVIIGIIIYRLVHKRKS